MDIIADIKADFAIVKTDFSEGLKTLAAALEANPALAADAAALAPQLRAAAETVESTLPILVNTGVNAALGALGPIGSACAPYADSYIDALIAKLVTYKSAVPPQSTQGAPT